MDQQLLAPGVPADYYERIYRAEEEHPWYRGMRGVALALAHQALTRPGARILDAGCGTGGFLRWSIDVGSPAVVAGVDLAASAIELARRRVPDAELRPAALNALPFPDASFDVVVSNDVLQHVDESELQASLSELRRVTRPGGTLLVRTNGSRRLRRERADWRAYDRPTLVAQLERAGFRVERVTYANMVASLYGAARGRVPHAPSEYADGVPTSMPGNIKSSLLSLLLGAEARYFSWSRSLPYGHTIFAVARR